MKIKITLSIIFFSAIVAWGFKIDDTPLQKLLKQLAKITASYPQEKIHLQLDKPYYAVGEDIWLKAYIVTAEKNEPSLLSKVLYIDLIDEKNEIRKNLKLPIENGTADGNISLIDSLQTGNYRIRAYTNYMRNYDHDFFFEKFIKIGNVVETLSADAKKAKDKKAEFSIQFFPEGGNLLAGIRNKIGIKAVTSDGLGANLSGYVINRNKEKVAEFATEHAGMGIFALMAQAKEDYSAIVTLTDGSIQSFNLPKVTESGYAVSVNATEDKVNIRVFGSADQVDGKELSVIAQANGVVCASFTSKLDKSVLTASLDKKSFPTGIIQFTLFNAENKPLSERLIFVNHHDELKIDIKNKEQANTKKKTTLDLFVGDVNNNPVDGNFSISVIDVGNVQINEDDETTILSNLLLTSDLKGHIEQPNYYFNTSNPDREKHLDNLLLTQGWRRFIWADVANAKEPNVKFRPEQSLEISGMITQFEKPLSNAKVSLISTTPGLFLKLDTVSDINGNFVFDRMDIPDSASFILQAKTTKESKDVKIVINSLPQVTSKAYNSNTVNIASYVDNTKKMFQELQKFNMLDKRILLKTVEIKAKPVLKPLLNVPNSANASGAVDYVITSKMLTGAINIFSPFYKSPGVIVKNGMIYRSRPPRSLSGSNPPMLLIVDGVQINQAMMPDYITSINPADVEGIEILTSDYNVSVLGSDASGGAVYITTRKGGGKNPLATNIARIKNAGFSVKKEFYKPDYDAPKTNQQPLDLRSTIYWNPNVNTNEKGQTTLNFFNASSPSKYQVTIEGIDIFGNIGRKTFTYEVKNSL